MFSYHSPELQRQVDALYTQADQHVVAGKFCLQQGNSGHEHFLAARDVLVMLEDLGEHVTKLRACLAQLLQTP